MDALGRVAAGRDRGDRQVLARVGDAVAAGPDLGVGRAAFSVHLDAAPVHRDRRARTVQRRGVEGLTDRLEHLVGGEHHRLARAGKLPLDLRGVFQLDAGDLAAIGEHALRLQPVPDRHPVGGSQILLEFGGVHLLLAAAVGDRHLFRAQQLRLHGRVDCRHAAANHHDAAPHRQPAEVGGLAQFGDEIDRIVDASGRLAFRPQRIDAAKPHAEEHRVIGRREVGEVVVAPQRHAILDGDAADRRYVVHLRLCEAVDALVGGDAVFVEPAGFRLGFQNGDVVPFGRQPVGGGEAGRAGADDGDPPAGRRCTLIELLALAHRDVGRIALQPADLHGLALGGLAHAGFLAQRLCRADPGAHAAEDVLVEDGLRRPDRIARRDLADEKRDVDRGRTRLHAGRVVAEVAAIGLDQRLVMVERRMQVREVVRVFGWRQTARDDAVP